MRFTSPLSLFTVLLLAAFTVVGCRPDDQRTDTFQTRPDTAGGEVTPELLATLDSGNVAYRNDDYEGALEFYGKATDMAPDVASGWFGIFMAHTALGNTEEANEALEQAQSLAPGASLIHPTPADTAGEGGGRT